MRTKRFSCSRIAKNMRNNARRKNESLAQDCIRHPGLVRPVRPGCPARRGLLAVCCPFICLGGLTVPMLCVLASVCRVRAIQGRSECPYPVFGALTRGILNGLFSFPRAYGGITHPSVRCNRPSRINDHRSPQDWPRAVRLGSDTKASVIVDKREIATPRYISG